MPQEEQLTYLQDKILLKVEQPKGLAAKDLVRRLRGSETLNAVITDYPNPDTVLTFPIKGGAEGRTVSIVLAFVKRGTVQRSINTLFPPENPAPINLPPAPEGPIKVTTAEPDFLIGGATHNAIGGGPGGPPEAWPTPPAGSAPWDFKINIAGVMQPINTVGGARANGAQVDIVIIDTAPPMHVIAGAWHKWPNHPIVPALLQTSPTPPSRLFVFPTDYDTLQPLSDHSLTGQRYLMSAHGLFVAGIIVTIAPQANLYLFEALSPYGVGSAHSIGTTIVKALDTSFRGNHLIFNISASIQDTASSVLELAVQSIHDKNGRILAAAGNDSTGALKPAPAGLPANYAGVTGVGALPPNAQAVAGVFPRASYSNMASRFVQPPAIPPAVDVVDKQGFMVLGGEPTPGAGVLGLYLGDMLNPAYADEPDEQGYMPNVTGWARWSGTSFATPIITGMCARLASAIAPPALLNLPADLMPFVVAGITTSVLGEHVIEVTQP